jgi:hypothetical protein
MGEQEYSGIATALLCLGHTMYELAKINEELSIQLAIDPGKSNTRATFSGFAVNMQRFRVYLAMLKGQLCVTMVHTPGVIIQSRRLQVHIRGKSRPSLKTDVNQIAEPGVPPHTAKSWEWYTRNAIDNFDRFEA